MAEFEDTTGNPEHRASMASGDHEYLGCVEPNAYRVIQPPVHTPEDTAAIAKARRLALYLITTGMAAIAGLLELFGAPPLLP